VLGLDSGGAEPWAYGITGLVQSTGEWWLQRRSMSRAHVVDLVTTLIWAAIAGVLRDAGIAVDPAQPLSAVRTGLRAAHPDLLRLMGGPRPARASPDEGRRPASEEDLNG
jgi:hypothetical protein